LRRVRLKPTFLEVRVLDLKTPAVPQGPSEASLAQLFRGELARSDRWRTRLDTTSNWALTTTAAVVSFGFANVNNSHLTFLVGIWLVLTFLFMEARRYRYYDLWIRRVRLIESGYWAPLLRHEPIDPDAMRELATEMDRPQIQLSLFSALAVRLDRVYGSVLSLLFLGWLVRLEVYPTPAGSFGELVRRAHVGRVPGFVILGLMLLVALGFLLVYLLSLSAPAPLGELGTRRRLRRMPLWQRLMRPYAVQNPRRHTPKEQVSD
jgi:uncharacterized membrane protein